MPIRFEQCQCKYRYDSTPLGPIIGPFRDGILVAWEPANAFSVGAIFREPCEAVVASECEPATGPENALLKIDGDRFLLSFHVSGITTVLNVNYVGTFFNIFTTPCRAGRASQRSQAIPAANKVRE